MKPKGAEGISHYNEVLRKKKLDQAEAAKSQLTSPNSKMRIINKKDHRIIEYENYPSVTFNEPLNMTSPHGVKAYRTPGFTC